MKKRKLATKFLALTMALTAAVGLTGCANTKPAGEQVKDIAEAVKSGDSEIFFKSMDKSERFDSYFDAVQNKPDSGLASVYVKLQEKMQGVTVELDEKDDSFDIYAEISSYDAYSAAVSKMYEAAQEGPEAFADMPTWLSAALDEAEEYTETAKFDARKDSSTLRYEFGANKEFFKMITCGLYDFMNATMTTCSDDEGAICFVSQGDKVIFAADFYYYSMEEFGFTEEDAQYVIDELLKEYEDKEGIYADAKFDGQGISEFVLISLDSASSWDLKQLGFITSTQTDYISLEQSIEGFEAEGMTCVTETFGITTDEETEK